MTKAQLLARLALYEKAFELATKNGLTYQYEGWGGRFRTRHTSPPEYRQLLLSQAEAAIQEKRA